MVTPSVETVGSVEKALEIFADKIVTPTDAEFNELGAYVFPLKSQIPVVLEIYNATGSLVERRALTRGTENEIINLYLGNEWQLFEMLEAQHKGSFEHGGVEKQLQAFHHSDQRYRQYVLDKGWVKTGEMGIKVPAGHEYYRVIGVIPRQAPPAYTFKGGAPKTLPIEDYSYTLAESRVPIPARTGTHSKLGDTDRRWYWNGVIGEDKEGRSAVGCGWGSDERGLVAIASRPLGRLGGGVVGTWRKAS